MKTLKKFIFNGKKFYAKMDSHGYIFITDEKFIISNTGTEFCLHKEDIDQLFKKVIVDFYNKEKEN